jgi:glucosamine-6-phosphate deaminase
MRLRLFRNAEVLARALARKVARLIETRPHPVLGLPAGRTPILLYRELVRLHARGRLDLSGVTTFNVDEFVGCGPSDACSYRAFMRRHLFGAVNVPTRRVRFPNGRAGDLAAECRRYERAIARAGGLDLLLLGLGRNGHVGFIEPAAGLPVETHVASLAPATRRANAALFGGALSRVPRRGLSMGIGTMLRARRIVLIVTGARKASMLARAMEGPVTPAVPASFLQLHAACEVWADAEAAPRLGRSAARRAVVQ